VATILRQLLLLLSFGPLAAPADERERIVESVLPALAYGSTCSSTVELQNLGDRPVAVDIEAHRSTGALVPLVGRPEMTVRLNPGERGSYKLQIEEETTSAWVKVRERVPSPRFSSAVAVAGTTECVIADQLRTTPREVAYPTRNPWFSGDVAQMRSDVISMINTSEHAAKASLCYSAGGLYSVPNETHPSPELTPICSTAFAVQIPPFGTREFPVERDGSSHFSLKTEGNAIVLQMLRPLEASVKMYTVDSTVKFGGEVSDGTRNNR
jgi:hypothetical protein